MGKGILTLTCLVNSCSLWMLGFLCYKTTGYHSLLYRTSVLLCVVICFASKDKLFIISCLTTLFYNYIYSLFTFRLLLIFSSFYFSLSVIIPYHAVIIIALCGKYIFPFIHFCQIFYNEIHFWQESQHTATKVFVFVPDLWNWETHYLYILGHITNL